MFVVAIGQWHFVHTFSWLGLEGFDTPHFWPMYQSHELVAQEEGEIAAVFVHFCSIKIDHVHDNRDFTNVKTNLYD